MGDRKTVDELLALYSLEPTLKDIYVEGRSDKTLIEWFLSVNEIKGVSVYLIDFINIADQVLDRHGLDKGSNRSRVIALSAELSVSLPCPCKVICIADRDYEDYLSSEISNNILEFTDYNSIELYFFNISMLNKFFHLVLGGFPFSAKDIMEKGTPILEELYIIRLANIALKWQMKWINFAKYVHFSNDISFDCDSFLKAYLLKNKKWSKRSIFRKKIEELRLGLKSDPRFRVRGHDLIEFLHLAVKKLRKCRKFGDSWTLQGAFTGCLELEKLSSEVLFQKLLSL